MTAAEPRRGPRSTEIPEEPRLLFVTYDGVLGGPGRSQVLPYLHAYREAGWSVHLLSFEKPELLSDDAVRRPVVDELVVAGVRWTVLPWRREMVGDLVRGLKFSEPGDRIPRYLLSQP